MIERGIHMDTYYVQSESTPRANYPSINFIHKPVMIYYFVNPVCELCWSIEVILKKMAIQYGSLFNIRPIISNIFTDSINRCTTNRLQIWQGNNRSFLSVGIKAAALQGNKAGRDFLKHIQEAIFLYGTTNSIEDMLLKAAKHANLDMSEFQQDLFSPSARKAFQGDIQLIQEMDVNQFPTFVFFSQYIEDHSIKISGIHSYETYVYVLKNMVPTIDHSMSTMPTIEKYLKKYIRVQTNEIAFIFNLTIKKAECKLKQLQLKQQVKKKEMNGKCFWEYVGPGSR